jgi:hypothetical protein
MFDSLAGDSSASPTIFFEYGADAAECERGSFEISERGLRLRTRWKLPVGMQYHVGIACPDGHGNWQHVQAEASVVDCTEKQPHSFAVTLFFVDAPAEFRNAIQSVGSGRDYPGLIS